MLNKPGLFNNPDRYRRDARPLEGGGAANQAATPLEQPRIETPKPAQREPARAEETPGSRLIVGPDIKLKGAEITDCDTLVVEGRVEASMDSRVMQIAEGGAFHGNVGVDVAEIRGRFEGELTCRKQLVIHPTGKVSGKIRYGRILIEEGGEVAGDVASLGTAKPSVVAATPAPKPAEAPSAVLGR